MSDANHRNKARAAAWWAEIDGARPHEMGQLSRAHLADAVVWQGFQPVGDLIGGQAIAQSVLAPLKRAFDGLQRQVHILMGGASDGRANGSADGAMWVGATGYLCGVQTGDIWGIPARNTRMRLRWSEFLEFDEQGRIIRIQCLIDVIDWLEQIGLSPLPVARGAPFVYPAPTGIDGILTLAQDPVRSADTLRFARRFIFDGLNGFDREQLNSMNMAGFFHQNLKWYGPGGIGACLSFAEFEDLHQRPWLAAFPDRQVGDLDNLIAEGDFVGASSLPGVWLTHSGPYLGQSASNKRASVNGIDFWLRKGDEFVENWVFVDMVHLFQQFGIDLMARVAHMSGLR